MARHCIGLDIGTSAIKLVQLRSTRKGFVLQNYGVEPVPPQAIVDGNVMAPGPVVDAIRNLVKRIHLRGKDAAIAVGRNAVIIKRVVMPHLEGGALEEQIEWEIRQNIPFNRDEVTCDYEVLVERTPQDQMEVLLVAAKNEVAQQYVQVTREAGLNPAVVDASALALTNAVEASVGLSKEESVAIILAGATHSTISIVVKGVPAFHREVNVGGNTYTEAIAQRLAVSAESAEAYKVGGATTSTPDVVPQEVHRILAQVSEQIAGEYQRTLDFFMSDALVGNLARIHLAGGTALVPQLAKAIQVRARIPVEIVDPFVNVAADPRRFDLDYLRVHAPMLAVAFGLALRRPGDSE
ncbi:MAG: type IV pilus assembly protein PilM [Deltaproteobacteria bacterium]|nr:MAG: type IV pilus assembly protein PilM [Deltaproteobacteria bacterium]